MPTIARPATAPAVSERVRERQRGGGVAPPRDPERAMRVVRGEIRCHNNAALARGEQLIDDEARCARDVLATLAGYGLLHYLDDPEIEEVRINAPDRIFVVRHGWRRAKLSASNSLATCAIGR